MVEPHYQRNLFGIERNGTPIDMDESRRNQQETIIIGPHAINSHVKITIRVDKP